VNFLRNIYKESVYLVCMSGKNLKRFLVFGVFALFAVSMMSGALADESGWGDATAVSNSDFTKSINDFFSNYIAGPAGLILGNVDGDNSGELFFVKFLFALIIFAVVFYSVKQVPNLGKGITLWVISIAVSLLAIRFLSTEAMINFIWLPQGVLGVALATLLPFILFFFFIESFNSALIRKVGWVTFAATYVMLAILRWPDLEQVGTGSTGFGFNLGWFYLIIAVLSILAILADKGIRGAYFHNKSMALIRSERELNLAKLEAKLIEVDDAIVIKDTPTLQKRKKALEDQIKKVNKDLA
jgi:hypothetical protein